MLLVERGVALAGGGGGVRVGEEGVDELVEDDDAVLRARGGGGGCGRVSSHAWPSFASGWARISFT